MAFLYGRAGRLTTKNIGFWPGQVMDPHSGVADPSHVQGTSFDDYTASRRLLNVRYTAGPRRLEGESCTAVTFDLHAPLNGRAPTDSAHAEGVHSELVAAMAGGAFDSALAAHHPLFATVRARARPRPAAQLSP